jgi:Chaperone of endosialidase
MKLPLPVWLMERSPSKSSVMMVTGGASNSRFNFTSPEGDGDRCAARRRGEPRRTGTGLAMGTLGNAPFVLGTSSTARMTLDGDSNVIDFAGGGQYNGANFLDASSRARKQDIRPLGGGAAVEALAGLEPVTFAYLDAPGAPRVGFIAEEVPALVARPGRTTLSALEIVAVLTKVVQAQQQVVREQEKAVQAQQKTIIDLTACIAELTARITALETRP